MQEDHEHEQPQQQYQTIVSKHVEVPDILDLDCSYPKTIYTTSHMLKATIVIVPHIEMANLPLEVEIKGHSNMYELNTITSDLESLQVTESFVFDEDDKARNALVGGSSINPSVYVQKNQQLHIEPETPGEYFLEGCQVFYQVDENKDRLEVLTAEKEYTYPVEFMLPPHLPVSLASKILKNIYMTIRYSLNLKFIYPQGHKHTPLFLSLSFQLVDPPKVYPHEELILSQQIRCYHEQGKQKDEVLTDKCNQFLKFICPEKLFKRLCHSQYSKRFDRYDLHYIQLTVVVNRDMNLFMLARSYRDPDKNELTFNRQKKNKDCMSELKEETESQPPQISLSSIKQINKRNNQFSVHKIDVKMHGELKDVSRTIIFSKTIYLTRENYDMIEGEAVVSLKQYLEYPHSCHNQLFDLHYFFTVQAYFEDEQMKASTFEVFKVGESSKELQL